MAIALYLGWSACARVRPLEGGPADERAPVLVTVTPPDSTAGLARQPKFELEFDEPLASGSVRAGLRIHPAVRIGDVEVEGRRVTIQIADSLPPDTTVVLVVGRNLQDAPGRNNKLPQEIALTYTTGPRLRSAGVTGRITTRGRDQNGVAVTWQPLTTESKRPRGARPPVAATSADGLFRLGGLPADRPFRLVAFFDVNGDLLLQEDELSTALPETLQLAEGEMRRGVTWSIVDPKEPSEWTGVLTNRTGVVGPAAFAVRRLPDAASDSAAAESTATAAVTPARADTTRPQGARVAPVDSSAWATARARLEPHGFVRREWTVVYASPRGDYSVRVSPGRVVWLAFVDARRDSVPGVYPSGDSLQFDWEPLVVGDTVTVAPGVPMRRRSIEIR